MKTIFTLAAIAAALSGVSMASAHDNAGGRWEWRTQPSFGPKSTVPARTRVRVKDGDTRMANCDCSMMKSDAARCKMDMHAKSAAPSAS
ncbi:hypothetical protein [Aquisediminimonas sediminicola]|uniref:hypothetical protein n=1 Tax=Alteraquisediminimonas sediminicola TaxID=2676787 RepID=UPI001C8E5216|nr:hypothetical protein [Aquisediminimonas sediminicola]